MYDKWQCEAFIIQIHNFMELKIFPTDDAELRDAKKKQEK